MARLSKILGPDGNPVDLDELFERDKAGPSLIGVRQPWSDHPADGLTPARLAEIHRAAAHGDPVSYLELAEDIEERDPHYLSVISTRKRSVAQLPITVDAASDDPAHVAHADLIRDWLNTDVLRLALFDLLDAVGKGFSVAEIEWESKPSGIVPAELVYRPQRWFSPDRVDGDTIRLREGGQLLPLPAHKFLIHRHKAKSGLTIRSGLARVASWAWMLKAFTARDWAIFVQNYGQPIRLGRYGNEHSAEDREILWRAIANVAGDCAAMIHRTMEIEFVQAKAAERGGDLYERRVDWLDRQVSKAVLGQTTTTDAVSGGHAVAQEHRLVQEDIERADAALVSATLTRQLVPLIVSLNFGPQDRYPRLNVGRPDEVPLSQVVEALDKLGPKGLTVEVSQVRDRLGFTEPAPGAAVIGTPQLAPGAQPGSLNSPRTIVSRHAAEAGLVERLVARTADEAADAFAGLEAEVRTLLEQSSDLAEAADRLARLKLDPARLADAILRMTALTHLAGRAEVIDEIEQ